MYLTQELRRYDRNWLFPYVTISWASGQWFESAVWEGWHDLLPSPAPHYKIPEAEIQGENSDGGRLYRIMMDDREGADEWVFFTQERGGSWINWDNRMFLWIGDHLGVFVVMLLGVTGAVGFFGTRVVRRVKSRGTSRWKDGRGHLHTRGTSGSGYDYESLDSRGGPNYIS